MVLFLIKDQFHLKLALILRWIDILETIRGKNIKKGAINKDENLNNSFSDEELDEIQELP